MNARWIHPRGGIRSSPERSSTLRPARTIENRIPKLLEAYPLEVGDANFPLEFDPDRDVDREHEWVGRTVEVAPHAKEVMSDLHGALGTIRGVIEKRGQVAGYEVEINEGTYWAPKKDFWLGRKYAEDVHLDPAKAVHLRDLLSHWSVQRDYVGPRWEGVERLCYELAKGAGTWAVETSGWSKWPSSTREGGDVKSWRYLVPTEDPDQHAAVTCHSVLHDDVWTLATHVHGTEDVDESALDATYAEGHWSRTLGMLRDTVEVLSNDHYHYEGIRRDVERRIAASERLNAFAREARADVGRAHREVAGLEPSLPERVDFAPSRVILAPGKVGSYRNPTDEHSYGISAVEPDVVFGDDPEYAQGVVVHELIHAAIPEHCETADHGVRFQNIASALDLPVEWRD